MAKKKRKDCVTGTGEWAKRNVNILKGCEHRCRYCYACANADQYGRIGSYDEWGTTYLHLCEKIVKKGWRDTGGTVMFPSSHDITPRFLEPCIETLTHLLDAGIRVLLTSKPHLACIKRICDEFEDHRHQILFRFTIGATSDKLLAFWEPGAPSFAERLACLKHACKAGFETSVSVEPMLDPPHVGALFQRLKPYVTHSIWLGKMNQIRKRVQPKTSEEHAACDWIEQQQTDKKIRAIYEQLEDEPLARWKDSIKEVVGLELATVAGQDA